MIERRSTDKQFAELREDIAEVKTELHEKHKDNVRRIEHLEKGLATLPLIRNAVDELSHVIREHTVSDKDELTAIHGELAKNTKVTERVAALIGVVDSTRTLAMWTRDTLKWCAVVAIAIVTVYATVRWAVYGGPLPQLH